MTMRSRERPAWPKSRSLAFVILVSTPLHALAGPPFHALDVDGEGRVVFLDVRDGSVWRLEGGEPTRIGEPGARAHQVFAVPDGRVAVIDHGQLRRVLGDGAGDQELGALLVHEAVDLGPDGAAWRCQEGVITRRHAGVDTEVAAAPCAIGIAVDAEQVWTIGSHEARAYPVTGTVRRRWLGLGEPVATEPLARVPIPSGTMGLARAPDGMLWTLVLTRAGICVQRREGDTWTAVTGTCGGP